MDVNELESVTDRQAVLNPVNYKIKAFITALLQLSGKTPPADDKKN